MVETGGDTRTVDELLAAVPNTRRRDDARTVTDLMRQVTGVEPALWSGNIVGFGSLHYRYESGREGDTPVVGLAPRAQALTLYGVINADADDAAAEAELARLGPHTTGKGCLYLKDVGKVDLEVLRGMIRSAWSARAS
ncbi:DUF1801 domain-containing protein [Nakamurella leprariae]|uniref:DUF1801 domain-containing protein n=1 Tax=Nakamurella leprariae TaxID=2803911 RepID=A0A939BVL9_9ACTN|nr:DUF1801 domain-containing protein [Nakamurella leprariae]MBM9466658.1 DUF1801 domain-containing protein [Nakamurella leprariae]